MEPVSIKGDVMLPSSNIDTIQTESKQPDAINTKKPSLYKQEKYAQSYADFFDKDVRDNEETNADPGNVLSQYTKDDADIVEKPKKAEEPKQEKSSFFSFSRFFGSKEKTFKAKVESDASFVYDPKTKQWINKNTSSKPTFNYASTKKEKTEPKKSEAFSVKDSASGLSGRYAGMKRANHSVVDLIPNIKKDKRGE